MQEYLKKVINLLDRNRQSSWVGHAIQGVIFTLPFSLLAELTGNRLIHLFGLTFVIGAFFHRELDDFVDPWMRVGWAYAVTKLKRDGLADFIAPYAASSATIVVVALTSRIISAL